LESPDEKLHGLDGHEDIFIVGWRLIRGGVLLGPGCVDVNVHKLSCVAVPATSLQLYPAQPASKEHHPACNLHAWPPPSLLIPMSLVRHPLHVCLAIGCLFWAPNAPIMSYCALVPWLITLSLLRSLFFASASSLSALILQSLSSQLPSDLATLVISLALV
jgi:hypothetical protein